VIRASAILTSYVAAAICGQPAASQRFEVASVKRSQAAPRSSSGIRTAPGRLDAYNVTLQRCLIGAYGVGPNQIFGGPPWLNSDRFEISAKADQPVNDDAALMVMLQDLLAERFQLVLHRETRSIPALVLEVAKTGPKLERATGGAAATNTSTGSAGVTIEARSADLNSFVRILSRHTDLPVVNKAKLEGTFNFKLHWTLDNFRPVGPSTDAPSLFTAIQEQLGLRLRVEKAPVEVLVIDHAEPPSEN